MHSRATCDRRSQPLVRSLAPSVVEGERERDWGRKGWKRDVNGIGRNYLWVPIKKLYVRWDSFQRGCLHDMTSVETTKMFQVETTLMASSNVVPCHLNFESSGSTIVWFVVYIHSCVVLIHRLMASSTFLVARSLHQTCIVGTAIPMTYAFLF